MKIKKLNGYELQITDKVDDLLNNYQLFFTPKFEDVFKAYETTSFNDVKVVFLGQDPYPNLGDAVGLCFSVSKESQIPKSLSNIFKKLQNELDIKKLNGDLTSWAEQGVLLINAVLTNEVSKTNAHKNLGWEILTENVVRDLSTRGNVIFVLLGNYAQSYAHFIDDKRNTILKTSHPSPLGAYRGFNDYPLFENINKELKKYKYKNISW